MNPDNFTPVSEKLAFGTKRIIGWIFVTTFSITFLGLFFWALFYSVKFANEDFIISLRNGYQNFSWSVKTGFAKDVAETYPPFDPIYKIQVVSSKDTTERYTYSFWGNFFGVGANPGTILLKDTGGGIYSFKVSASFSSEFPNLSVNSSSVPAYDRLNLINNELNNQSKLMILWKDDRTLEQIIRENTTNSSKPLNSNSTDYFGLIQFY